MSTKTERDFVFRSASRIKERSLVLKERKEYTQELDSKDNKKLCCINKKSFRKALQNLWDARPSLSPSAAVTNKSFKYPFVESCSKKRIVKEKLYFHTSHEPFTK